MRSASQFKGQIIAAFGRHLIVRDAQRTLREARPFGRKLSVVCGDEVLCEADARHEEAHVMQVLPRRTCLYRSNLRAGEEPVVANVSLMLVVLAPVPVPDLFVIDRYLSAAASGGMRAAVIVNKSELPLPESLQSELHAYERIGYLRLGCSADTGAGLAAVQALCQDEIGAFVGQSGVGKSSLIGRMVPQADIRTGGLMREEDGRHTTTASRLYDLPTGGHLIDSPGVRDFAPSLARLESSSLGFLEIAALAPGCRFDDCQHLHEPACAVRAACESGRIAARRYESYRRLRRLCADLRAAAGPGKKKRSR